MKNLILFLTLFFTSYKSAQIINVPSDQSTIQQGINASADGDTVLVAEGTYFENINFRGKAITVASRFILDQDTSHISETIIDGSQPSHPDSGSVVTFNSGEDTTSVLLGFTITGGTGTIISENAIVAGGGIYCDLSGAKILYNYIQRDTISTALSASGGGISAGPLGSPAFVVIKSNKIRYNTVIGEIFPMGGGLDIRCNGTIINNVIENNLCKTNTDQCGGGGMITFSWGGYIHIEKNIFSHNRALSYSNAEESGIGGGFAVVGNTGIVRNNIIKYNEVSAQNSCFGPGAFFEFTDTTLIFENNIIAHNYFSNGYCNGGALCVWLGDLKIMNNIMYNNSATVGGGICLFNGSFSQVINNTVTGNLATDLGGGLYGLNATLSIMNTIFWDNSAPSGPQIYQDSGLFDVLYSDIEGGGFSGEGNIDNDPLFIEDDSLFHLSANSPCIDTGNSDSEYNDPEDPNNPGFALWPALGTVRNDMGAYGGQNPLVVTTVKDQTNTINCVPKNFLLSQNYPNPFNPSTVIRYQLPSLVKSEMVNVKLVVYDVLGREVATLVNEQQKPGYYEIKWDANNQTSGVYFYQLISGNFVESKKMVLIR